MLKIASRQCLSLFLIISGQLSCIIIMSCIYKIHERSMILFSNATLGIDAVTYQGGGVSSKPPQAFEACHLRQNEFPFLSIVYRYPNFNRPDNYFCTYIVKHYLGTNDIHF